MGKQVRIKKLSINIGNQEINLTLKQAQELQEILNDTFGVEKIVEKVIRHEYRPYWYPYTVSSGGNVTITDHLITSDTARSSAAEWLGKIDDGHITLTANQV